MSNGISILTIVDEPDVESFTSMISDYEDKKIEVIFAESAAKAKEILEISNNIAIILLDVVIEEKDD